MEQAMAFACVLPDELALSRALMHDAGMPPPHFMWIQFTLSAYAWLVRVLYICDLSQHALGDYCNLKCLASYQNKYHSLNGCHNKMFFGFFFQVYLVLITWLPSQRFRQQITYKNHENTMELQNHCYLTVHMKISWLTYDKRYKNSQKTSIFHARR